MNGRFWSLLLSCSALSAFTNPTVASAQEAAAPRSATIARDVNGFRLGMTVAEARRMTALTYIGGDQFEAESKGFSYNFGVTPRGRIYRVQSTQQLGDFTVDRHFIAALEGRLRSKYGQPTSLSGDVFHWALRETVTHDSGQQLPFTTMWMSAYVGGFGARPTLEITIIDFRILWTDQAAVNLGPQEAAANRMKF